MGSGWSKSRPPNRGELLVVFVSFWNQRTVVLVSCSYRKRHANVFLPLGEITSTSWTPTGDGWGNEPHNPEVLYWSRIHCSLRLPITYPMLSWPNQLSHCWHLYKTERDSPRSHDPYVHTIDKHVAFEAVKLLVAHYQNVVPTHDAVVNKPKLSEKVENFWMVVVTVELYYFWLEVSNAPSEHRFPLREGW